MRAVLVEREPWLAGHASGRNAAIWRPLEQDEPTARATLLVPEGGVLDTHAVLSSHPNKGPGQDPGPADVNWMQENKIAASDQVLALVQLYWARKSSRDDFMHLMRLMGATSIGMIVTYAVACSGNASREEVNPNPDVVQSAPKYYSKESQFTDREAALIRKAQASMREQGIELSGLEETVMLWEGFWYVLFRPAGEPRGPGGGWSVKFTYPAGDLVEEARRNQ